MTGEFAESDPTLQIVMVSSHTDEVALTRVFESPVIGFVDKASEDLNGLERAMRAVLNWETYFSVSVHDHPLRVALSRLHYSKVLSDREVSLMHCFGLGMSNEAIAEEADLAVGTIQTHRRNIMKKLELRNMGELMRYCAIKGFTRLSLPGITGWRGRGNLDVITSVGTVGAWPLNSSFARWAIRWGSSCRRRRLRVSRWTRGRRST